MFAHEKMTHFSLAFSFRTQKRYSREYDPTTSIHGTMIDWWGFHNGKDNRSILSPTIKTIDGINKGKSSYGADIDPSTEKS